MLKLISLKPYLLIVGDVEMLRHQSNLIGCFIPGLFLGRLGIFHFMKRFRYRCTTESHPLYGKLMRQLSSARFEWDNYNMTKLISPQKSLPGGRNKSDGQVSDAV